MRSILGVTTGVLKLDEVVKQVTSVCFGGQNYDELFVTSIMDSDPVRSVGFSGRVFRVNIFEYLEALNESSFFIDSKKIFVDLTTAQQSSHSEEAENRV